MADSKILMFDQPRSAGSSIDPGLLALMNQNGGFGGNNNMLFLFLWMMWASGGNMGGFGNNGNGTGFLANQANQNLANNLVLEAINGRADSLAQLAQITNNGIEATRGVISGMQTSIATLAGQIGISGQEIQNAVSSGNASLSRQLCECCCENRLAIVNQTNQLGSQADRNAAAAQLQLANHDASVRLQLAQNEAADQLSVCQQTNALQTQANVNTNSILGAIQSQNAMLEQRFCEIKERELQGKIDTLLADNALLRSNAVTTAQTQQFAAMLGPIQAELAAIKAAQPSTMTLPNTQYTIVPSWAATGATDFISSYWASRLANATQGTTTTTTQTTQQ